MRKGITIVAILALFFLAACAPQAQPESPTPQPQEQLPPPPETPTQATPPAMDDVKEIDDGLDAAFGPRDAQQVVTVDDVRCDPATRSLTFRFRNLDETSWQMDNDVPFPAPKDLAGVRVTLNNYEVNGKRHPLDKDGTELFGPGARFSENCGGTTVLAPGEEAVCTIRPIDIKTETTVSQGANELRINGVGKDGIVRFACA